MKNELFQTLPLKTDSIHSGFINHKWIDISSITRYSAIYFPIIKRIAYLLPVKILRNKYNSGEGIYIVGRPIYINKAFTMIHTLLTAIEYDVNVYIDSKKYKRLEIHGNKAISDYRYSRIKRILTDLSAFEPFHDYSQERKLYLEYIKQHNLKTKKVFYGKK